jgi:hypothetical protein
LVNCIEAFLIEELFIFTQGRKEEKRSPDSHQDAKRSLRLLYCPSRPCLQAGKFARNILVSFRGSLST